MVCILTAWMGKSAGAAIRTAATTRPPPTHLLLLKDDKIDPWQPMRQSVAPNELFHCYFCSFTYEQVNCNATNDYVGEITIWPRIIVTITIQIVQVYAAKESKPISDLGYHIRNDYFEFSTF
jgi:hypothetical protein